MDIYFNRILNSVARRIAIFPIIISLLIIADDFLPVDKIHTPITKIEYDESSAFPVLVGNKYIEIRNGPKTIFFEDNSLRFSQDEITSDVLLTLEVGSIVNVEISKIFNRVLYFSAENSNVEIKKRAFAQISPITILIFLFFIPIVLLIKSPKEFDKKSITHFFVPYTVIINIVCIFTVIYLSFIA